MGLGFVTTPPDQPTDLPAGGRQDSTQHDDASPALHRCVCQVVVVVAPHSDVT
jgi:hypothetical protein